MASRFVKLLKCTAIRCPCYHRAGKGRCSTRKRRNRQVEVRDYLTRREGTTNVISTFLLALLMLPKMRETSQWFNTTLSLVVVSSGLHFVTKFPEKGLTNVFQALNSEGKANMRNRYSLPPLMCYLVMKSND